jgi:pimeloyl-ACP methyl ester carboxylesterase
MSDVFNSKFRSRIIQASDTNIHFVHNCTNTAGGVLRSGSCEIMLLLHGFPEFYRAWEHVMPLLAENYLVIVPDQRGFNLSSAPQDVASYQTKYLVGDMIALMDQLVPGSHYHLVGHDWGASIAYALAMRQSHRIKTLSIVNGVHPIPFQRALYSSKEQIAASQYFHTLCADEAAEKMAENGFARTFSMLEKFSSGPWLDQELREEYLKAWSQPGRMNAMLNWYRASPMQVPVSDEKPVPAPLLNIDPENFRIKMPHLLLWGMEDTALLPVARSGLDEFADDLKIVEVEDAGHWINHTHPDFIAGEIHQFIQSNISSL